jgi:hypothetical protein
MAKRRRRRGRSIAIWLVAPTVLMGILFAWLSVEPERGAAVGALVGLAIGIGLLAYPNLDRGVPDDEDHLIMH